MEMEKATHGVDYHRDGCDVSWMLRAGLFAAIVVPVMLVAYLLLAVPR